MLVVLLVLVGLGSGCCRECTAPEPETPAAEEAVAPAAVPEAPPVVPEEDIEPAPPAAEGAAVEPATKHPMVSQETWDMPAGIERSRQVRLEVMEKQIGELSAQIGESATTLMDVEKQARTDDPEIGRLYNEMVKGTMAYRKALEEHSAYANARQQNVEATDAYHTLMQERDDLKKEISQ
jgi:hypothetical protein